MFARSALSLAILPALALGTLALSGCGEREVKIIDPNSTQELSGRWGVQNSKKVAAELIPKSLQAGWCANFTEKEKRNPIVRLGGVKARTDGETIATDSFMKEMRREFVNSGKVDVVDEDRQSIEAEQKASANGDAKPVEMGQQDAADFLLKGTITTMSDQDGLKSTKYYAVDLELTNTKTGRIVWTDRTEVGKAIEQSRWK